MKRSGIKKNQKDFLRNLPLRIVLIIQTIIVVFPLLWNIMSSLKSNTEILTSPWILPERLVFENYKRAFVQASMGDYVLNSVIVVFLSLVFLMVFAVPASYTLTRFKFFGSNIIMNVYMACIFVQASYIIVPLFLQMNMLGMLDNLVWLSLVYAVFQFPFAIFLLSGFIKTIPKEYEEAAMIDGYSYYGILLKIIIPMAKSGIFTVALMAGMGFWNEYAIALTLIQSPEKYTVPVGITNLFEVQRYATDWGALFAALVIMLIPTVIIFAVYQDKLIQGINIGGIKS